MSCSFFFAVRIFGRILRNWFDIQEKNLTLSCSSLTSLNILQTMSIPFQTIDWNAVPKTEHIGENGIAYWQTMQYNGLRIRIVEYSKGYLADHWCRKGHIVHCLEGEFISELEDGQKFRLTKGSSYVVSDELSSHRSMSEEGVTLMIIDGDFLQ